jgi:hypothetical protein
MTKIAISLAAVLLLILAIGYFAMRFLRADDTDDFDDDLPAEPSRPRGRASAPERARDGRAAKEPASRAGRSARGYPDPSLPNPGLPSPGLPNPGRPGTSRQGRSQNVARPARGRNSREYAASPPPRAAEPVPDDRGYGDRRAASPAGARGWAATDAESTQLMGSESRPDLSRPPSGRGDQGRRDEARPAARAASSPRSARAKRSGELSGKDWDSLSDVDYWAELASDKPLTTTAQPAGPDGPSTRHEPAAASDATAVLPARRRNGPGGPAAPPLLPGDPGSRGDRGDRGQPGQPGQPGRGRTTDRDRATDRGRTADRGRASGRDSGGRPASPASRRPRDLPATPYGDSRDPEGGIAALARLGGGGSSPPVLDDDPLTSPSFPAIRDDDSRSYRSRRPEAAAAGYPAASADPLAGYDSRPAERSRPRGKRARPDDYPSYGQQASRPDAAPGGYPPPAVPVLPSAPAAGYRDYADLPATTAGSTPPGNPYGSYVSPAPGTPPAARPDRDAYGYPDSQETQRYAQRSGHHLAPEPAPPAPGHAPPGQSPLGYPGAAQTAAGHGAPGFPAGDHPMAGGPAADYAVPADFSSSHVVPIYAAPVPAAPEPAAGGYGSSWYGAPGSAPYAHDPAAGQYGQAPAEGYPGASYPGPAHPGTGYPAADYGATEYPAAYSGSLYDQPAYPPADPPGAPQDQNGYGTPDSGYGASAYGGYPGY